MASESLPITLMCFLLGWIFFCLIAQKANSPNHEVRQLLDFLS